MPSNYKVTYFIEAHQNPIRGWGGGASYGFTETWYMVADSIEDALRQASTLGRTSSYGYVTRRAACLPRMYFISWVRVSDTANPRLTKTANVGIQGTAAEPDTGPVGASFAAQVTCALLVDFVKLPGTNPLDFTHHRRWLMRGLASDITNGNVINPDARSFNAIRDFLRFLARGQLNEVNFDNTPRRLFYLMRYTDPAALRSPITALTVAASLRQITVTSLLPLALGDRVIITGVVAPQRVNRVWTAKENSTVNNTTRLGTSPRDIAAADLVGDRPRIRKANYLYGPPDQYVLIGLRTRITGRPFHLTRGRRRIL